MNKCRFHNPDKTAVIIFLAVTMLFFAQGIYLDGIVKPLVMSKMMPVNNGIYNKSGNDSDNCLYQ